MYNLGENVGKALLLNEYTVVSRNHTKNIQDFGTRGTAVESESRRWKELLLWNQSHDCGNSHDCEIRVTDVESESLLWNKNRD